MIKIAALLFFLSAPAWAAMPVISTAPASPSIILDEPFVTEASKRLDLPLAEASSLRRRGFGKTEVLSFVAIAKISPKPWKELLKDREKGTPLREMAKEAGLDYNEVFKTSDALRREIEKATGATAISP